MASSQTFLSRDQIRVLALRALIKERYHSKLRQQRRYSLGGAISSVATMATRGTNLSQSQCFRQIQAECERLLGDGALDEQVLLQAAREWSTLPEKDRRSRTIVVTPTFASLVKVARSKRARKASTTSGGSEALF